MTDENRRLVVGISGASGAILGIRLLEILRELAVETHLVVTPAARQTIQSETTMQVGDLGPFGGNTRCAAIFCGGS